MVDTERFQINPQCARFVSEVAASLARGGGDNRTHVLQVATYLPLDVESVGRILDGLTDDPGVEDVEDGGLNWIRFEDPDTYSLREFDLDAGEHLEQAEGLTKTLNALKSDEGFSRKVREQHEILSIVAEAGQQELDLSYFTSRSEIPSAKVQSLLNGFGAEGYIDIEYDEDSDTLTYTFPPLEYPEPRFDRNMSLQEEVEPQQSQVSIWAIILIVTILLLIVVLLIKSSL